MTSQHGLAVVWSHRKGKNKIRTSFSFISKHRHCFRQVKVGLCSKQQTLYALVSILCLFTLVIVLIVPAVIGTITRSSGKWSTNNLLNKHFVFYWWMNVGIKSIFFLKRSHTHTLRLRDSGSSLRCTSHGQCQLHKLNEKQVGKVFFTDLNKPHRWRTNRHLSVTRW